MTGPRLQSSQQALSQRELQVLVLVAEGNSNPQIAEHLFLARSTVKTHLERMAVKLGTGDRAGMVGAAYRSKIL